MGDTFKDLIALLFRPTLSKVHKFKDAHRGETCYLFGDGPSVKWFDLGAFSDKISFSLSFLPFHNDFHKLQTRYLLLTEPWYFYPCFKTTVPPYKWWRNRIQLAYRDVIQSNPDKEFFVNLSNFPILRGKNITYLFREFYDSRLPPNYISNRVHPFVGSATTSITLASYMGFRHVYLVGFDYTLIPARNHHWYEKGRGDIVPHPGYNEEFFKVAREFIDITTVTLDGPSECLPSISYEELTGRKPVYKENIDLVSERVLRVMDTWPDYHIFFDKRISPSR